MMPDEHFRRLERMYLGAPTNAYYRPTISITHGEAKITIPVREEFFHAAHAVHGSVYFKGLDDAAFFAANSLVPDVFVLTAAFELRFLGPVRSGVLTAHGRVVTNKGKLMRSESQMFDDQGLMIAEGRGTFMRSSIGLTPDVGYR